MTRTYADYTFLRKDVWYFRISIPTAVRHRFGNRKEIWKSLGTKNKHEAYGAAGRLATEHQRLFKEAQLGANQNGFDYQILKNFMSERGIAYQQDIELLKAESPSIVQFLSAVLAPFLLVANPEKIEVAAMGGVAAPTLSLDGMFTRYKELSAGKWADLDRDAQRKKFNRYAEPIADFKKTMGDLDVLQITPGIAFDYAAKLGKRIEEKTLKSETAKKKLLFLSAMVRKVFQADFPSNANPFENATIDHEGDGETRKPFTEDEVIAVRKAIAASNANEQLKAISVVLELTGCHAKEIALLSSSDIKVGPEVEIPHIKIGVNENRKRLKTGGARYRDIPLLPEVLEIFKRFPNGFPHYCYSGGAENLTQSLNKLIKTAVKGKTTYSFRHRLVDLLRNHRDVKDDCLKAIVGHNAGQTGDYGEGFDLENKLDALNKAQERAAYLRSKKTR